MPNTDWQKPVTVALPGVGRREISNAFEALAVLTEGWPSMTGQHFLRARLSCKAVLDERMTPEQARSEFEQAAREAGSFLN